MSKKMLINASHPEENRVAIVVDGILSELDIEIAGQEQSKGNIYKAVVVRVETGLQAAFVDYGAEKLGFLQIGEIHPQLYPAQQEDSKRRPRIAEILQRGQEILVQIVKEERGNKGAALTTFLSIPGRYMVLMPDSTTKGVSRKISLDSERRKLKKTMAELDLPERMGYIVRTAGIGKDKEELKRDFDYLVRLFEGIIARKDQIKAPAQLYQESNLAIRSIRDYFSAEMDEVLIDDSKVFQDTKDFFSLVMPELKHLVKRHRERRPIFSRYQIEEQIEGLSKNQAPLPSGGSIVIDQTEALVAIDVNSGKMSSESGIEATAFKTNIEAAAEVGRQLRLRDLGGLIVIDFIDMRDRKNIREVEHELRKSLKDDKAKVSVGRISQFGLMEMSRQRLKPVLSVGAYLECPHCKGIGRIKSVEAQAIAFLRHAHTAAAKGQLGHIEAKVPLEVANHLLNQKRSTITELERQLNLKISLIGSCDLLPGDMLVELHKREKEPESSREIHPVSHDNQIEMALAAAQDREADPELTETELSDTGETTEEPAEKSKKRRRRRRKKPAPAPVQEQVDVPESESPAEEGDAQPETQESAPPERQQQEAPLDTVEQTAVVTTEDPEEKPKPRRRGRRKAPVKEATAEASTAADPQLEASAAETTTETAEVTAAAAAPEVEQATVRKPQKRRTRKPTQKTPAAATKETLEPPEAVEASAKPAVPESAPEPDKEKPKRRTRRATRKTPVSTKGEQGNPDAVESPAKAATPEPAPTETAEEKPKRRTRRTTKATQAAAESTSVEAPPESAQAAAEQAEKPKRRTRKTTKKTTAAAQSSETAQPESSETEKPQPRRRQAKKPAPTESVSAVEHIEDTDKAEGKPQRRPRKTTKKKGDEPAKKATDAGPAEAAPTEKPKQKPRRAATKKKPEPSEPSSE